jgi:hypothetical protein
MPWRPKKGERVIVVRGAERPEDVAERDVPEQDAAGQDGVDRKPRKQRLLLIGRGVCEGSFTAPCDPVGRTHEEVLEQYKEAYEKHFADVPESQRESYDPPGWFEVERIKMDSGDTVWGHEYQMFSECPATEQALADYEIVEHPVPLLEDRLRLRHEAYLAGKARREAGGGGAASGDGSALEPEASPDGQGTNGAGSGLAGHG